MTEVVPDGTKIDLLLMPLIFPLYDKLILFKPQKIAEAARKQLKWRYSIIYAVSRAE
jgi:hypothetical protein